MQQIIQCQKDNTILIAVLSDEYSNEIWQLKLHCHTIRSKAEVNTFSLLTDPQIQAIIGEAVRHNEQKKLSYGIICAPKAIIQSLMKKIAELFLDNEFMNKYGGHDGYFKNLREIEK